jgi:arsenate reductase
MLVLCTGNSARSQIAEALLRTLGTGRVIAASAGSNPAVRVNPFAVDVLGEHGIEWEGRVPESVDRYAGESFDLVITVCDHARDVCPVLPGAGANVHWGLIDPAQETDPVRARAAFAETFAALDERIRALLRAPLERMAPQEIRTLAQEIHESARNSPER